MGFEILVPENEDELISLMEEGDYQFLAGGTDLFVKIKKDLINPERIIDLTKAIDGPKFQVEQNEVKIKATTTHAELAESSLINKEFPVLASSAGAVGATQLRNMGTIGGNICNASPSADTLIALYLLNADVDLVSSDGRRSLSIKDFITGPGETELASGEYVESITVPKLSGKFRHFFKKVGRRNALDISVCSMGFILKATKEAIEEIRLAYGAVAPTVIRPGAVEDFLQGKTIDKETISRAQRLLKEEISPINDIRGSAEYRETVALRTLEQIRQN
ncbi:xanthine dehydrogenase family protein subunit M [Candidatus Bipolaricaulota bacterium]|nr:xanthine dehydrogenase family protein subunit M [Candidatus Bipolaricaulota bacterium]MBS3813899.1 xanthine dehydrogenase family protein subunit M [Candidatus Bipolaricaulota bacterium]MBS3825132.1 xanthine dehydrogenase family protein subunit M [Candidatus Bipolaricaulota bacterium]